MPEKLADALKADTSLCDTFVCDGELCFISADRGEHCGTLDGMFSADALRLIADFMDGKDA